MKLSTVASHLFALSALTSWAAANVLVVAPTGGDYSQIRAAVDAASDGDTILVKSGSYAAFVVADKALSIVADAGNSVQVNGGISVQSLSAGKTLGLESLNASGWPSSGTPQGILLSNSHGHVRVEGCSFVGSAAANGNSNGFDAIHVEACDDVSLAHTSSIGGSGSSSPNCCWNVSGTGLYANNSSIAIYDCDFHGGNGTSAGQGHNGAYGGAGCRTLTSACFASGSSFVGGDGGNAGFGIPFADTYGGNGGNGIEAFTASTVQLLDDFTQAGPAGQAGGGGSSYPGSPGHDRVVSGGGTIVDFAGTAKHFISPTPVRENTIATLTFRGVPGETVRLLIARTPGFAFDALESGVLLLGDPIRTVHVGMIPPSGALNVHFPIPSIGPALESSLLQLQARFTDPQGNAVLSGPSTMVILNQAF